MGWKCLQVWARYAYQASIRERILKLEAQAFIDRLEQAYQASIRERILKLFNEQRAPVIVRGLPSIDPREDTETSSRRQAAFSRRAYQASIRERILKRHKRDGAQLQRQAYQASIRERILKPRLATKPRIFIWAYQASIRERILKQVTDFAAVIRQRAYQASIRERILKHVESGIDNVVSLRLPSIDPREDTETASTDRALPQRGGLPSIDPREDTETMTAYTQTPPGYWLTKHRSERGY